MRKLLDVTHGYGNVVYEIMNEPPAVENPGGESAEAFAYFTEYWAWFVKDYLARRYDVARLVSQDEANQAYEVANVDIADARWGEHHPMVSEAEFLGVVLPTLAASVRTAHRAHAKVTDLDEFGNYEVDPARLRKELWTIVTSGGHVHVEDPCNPEFRPCVDPDARRVSPAQGWMLSPGFRCAASRHSRRNHTGGSTAPGPFTATTCAPASGSSG